LALSGYALKTSDQLLSGKGRSLMRGSVAFLTGDFVIALKHFVSQVLRKDLEISVSFDLLKELLPGKTINFPPANTLSGVYSLNFLL
jgi:hypothetical protein